MVFVCYIDGDDEIVRFREIRHSVTGWLTCIPQHREALALQINLATSSGRLVNALPDRT